MFLVRRLDSLKGVECQLRVHGYEERLLPIHSMKEREMNFDTSTLAYLLFNLYAGHIRYDMTGSRGKAEPRRRHVAWKKPSAISRLDCSGFVQYVIHESTTGGLRIPQGSMKQREWLAKNGYNNYGRYRSASAAYATLAQTSDDTVRIAFRNKIIGSGTPTNPYQVGHVWFVINGKTYESTATGGKAIGPKSLAWSVRRSIVDHFFLLGRVPGFSLHQTALGI